MKRRMRFQGRIGEPTFGELPSRAGAGATFLDAASATHRGAIHNVFDPSALHLAVGLNDDEKDLEPNGSRPNSDDSSNLGTRTFSKQEGEFVLLLRVWHDAKHALSI